MKKLTSLSIPPIAVDRYIVIRDKKQLAVRQVLKDNHVLIAAQFTAFDAAVNAKNLETLTADPTCADISEQLRACYSIKTEGLLQLKTAIKAAQPKGLLKYCPMCGTTKHSTFDHYIPGEAFPEFSVHPENLVPCCSLCNSTKDDFWLDAADRRYFLHLYSDDIPAEQFLFADLHENDDADAVGSTFRLDRPASAQNATWRLITSHYSRLKLLSRFADMSNEEISDILMACKAHLEEGGNRPRAFLRRMAASRRRISGRNHWLAVLMDAMADHDNFLDWVHAID